MASRAEGKTAEAGRRPTAKGELEDDDEPAEVHKQYKVSLSLL
jgi:hypothetical protein